MEIRNKTDLLGALRTLLLRHCKNGSPLEYSRETIHELYQKVFTYWTEDGFIPGMMPEESELRIKPGMHGTYKNLCMMVSVAGGPFMPWSMYSAANCVPKTNYPFTLSI